MNKILLTAIVLTVLAMGCASSSASYEERRDASEFCAWKTGEAGAYVRDTWSNRDGIVNCHYTKDGKDVKANYAVDDMMIYLRTKR